MNSVLISCGFSLIFLSLFQDSSGSPEAPRVLFVESNLISGNSSNSALESVDTSGVKRHIYPRSAGTGGDIRRGGRRYYYQQQQQTEASPVVTDVNWISQAIHRHNYYRYLHHAPPLRFNITLCQISQAYANRLARENSWGHNYAVLSRYSLGENLAKYTQSGSRRYVNASVSVDLWYREIYDYNFQTGLPKTRSAIGHFTQLVWRSTYQMGTAFAVRRFGNRNFVYVVANYYPRGNVNGGYLTNVLPRRRYGKSLFDDSNNSQETWSLDEVNAENDEAIERYKYELIELQNQALKELEILEEDESLSSGKSNGQIITSYCYVLILPILLLPLLNTY